MCFFSPGSVKAECQIVVNKVDNVQAASDSAQAIAELSGSTLTVNGTNVTVSVEIGNATGMYSFHGSFHDLS